ncbi:MAG TPA: hypothetical protein VK463_15670 [Desulfomonilaceae bacterium]|nr:hypothetical protein [Desulfomonilaceae bacterium]
MVPLFLISATLVLSDTPVCAKSAPNEDTFLQKLEIHGNPESVLDEILSRAEFKDSNKESWIDQIRERLVDEAKRILAWMWRQLPDVPGAEMDVFWTVIGSFVIAAVLVIGALLAVRALNVLKKKKPGSVKSQDSDSGEIATSDYFRSLALRRAEQGNFRDALISMFRFVLVWMDEHGKLSLHHFKTNREVLKSLKPDEPLRETLSDMIPVFDRVKYGNYPCDKHEYEKFLAMARRVHNGED